MSAAVQRDRGFTLIEVLAATAIIGVMLLSLATMVLTGYRTVDDGGKTTLAVAAGRQVLEDLRLTAYDDLAVFDGFDTEDPGTLPGADPQRTAARRWRYGAAGTGNGWAFTAAERGAWPTISEPGFHARLRVDVDAESPTLSLVTVTVTAQGRSDVQMATLINRP